MTRKRKPGESPPITPELNGVLREIRNQAEENFGPIPGGAELEKCPKLLELISPGLVEVVIKGTDGKKRRELREPLLMVSWDRGAGRWKWAVNDRTLKYTVYGWLETFMGLAEGIEECLQTGKYQAKDNEKT